jgi:hypothetical protein
MITKKMSVFNDDGLPIDLGTVLVLFLMPNLILVTLTTFAAHVLHLSKTRPRLKHFLGNLANFFAKGALDRIIRHMVKHIEAKKQHHEEHIMMKEKSSRSVRKDSNISRKNSPVSSSSKFIFEEKHDSNYLLLVPLQLDLLLTVFVYKILTREVYPETCQSYLTTYHNRQQQVICWLKNTNKNISNLSFNITLQQYCLNQSITYINYEHNDVICAQFVFKLVNIIDTVTNIFAWHQAMVFIVTRSIVFFYWCQRKLRKTTSFCNLYDHQRRIMLLIIFCSLSFIYILVFVLILPLSFVLMDRRRVDLTRHLIYACSKFTTAAIVQVNLYTLYQWHSIITNKEPILVLDEEQEFGNDRRTKSSASNGNCQSGSALESVTTDTHSAPSPTNWLTPEISV